MSADSDEGLLDAAGAASLQPSEGSAEGSEPTSAPAEGGQRPALRLALGSLLALVIGLVITDQVTKPCTEVSSADDGGTAAAAAAIPCCQAAIHSLVAWVREEPALGVLAVIVTYCVATIAFVPGSIITLSVGAAFAAGLGLPLGVALGSVAVFLGATAGATASFLLARFVLREKAVALMQRYPKLRALDTAVGQGGLRIVLLLRLSPVVPFNALNYVCGTTALELRDFVLGSVGMIPGCIGYVYIGAAVGHAASGAEDSDAVGIIKLLLIIVGALATVFAVGIASKSAKRELDAILAQEDPKESVNPS